MQKKLTDKLIDDCTKTIEETKFVDITFTENENNIVLMSIAFTVFTGITVYLVYCNWSLINDNIHCIKFNNYKKIKI